MMTWQQAQQLHASDGPVRRRICVLQPFPLAISHVALLLLLVRQLRIISVLVLVRGMGLRVMALLHRLRPSQ